MAHGHDDDDNCRKEAYECPFTFEELERLERNIGLGIKEVQYNDKKTTFRSIKEMQIAANFMRKKLGIAASKKGRRGLFGGKRLTMRPSKGLNNCSTKEHSEDERFDRNEDY